MNKSQLVRIGLDYTVTDPNFKEKYVEITTFEGNKAYLYNEQGQWKIFSSNEPYIIEFQQEVPQLGHLVRLSLDYQVTNPNYKNQFVEVMTFGGNQAYLYFDQGEWKIFGSNPQEPYVIIFEPNVQNHFLTGLLDIDVEILNYLNMKDLTNVCLTNKYAAKICGSEVFWQRRVVKYFPEAESKPESKTWKQYHQELYEISLIGNNLEKAIEHDLVSVFERLNPGAKELSAFVHYKESPPSKQVLMHGVMRTVFVDNRPPRQLYDYAVEKNALGVVKWILKRQEESDFGKTSLWTKLQEDPKTWGFIRSVPMLELFLSLKKPPRTVWVGATPEMINYLASKGKSWHPDQKSINMAMAAGNVATLEAGAKLGIFPTSRSVGDAAKSNHVTAVKWALDHGVKPSKTGIEESKDFPEMNALFKTYGII